MSIRMFQQQTDAEFIERARNAVATGRKCRWFLLAFAGCLFVIPVSLTLRVVGALDRIPAERLTEGFIYGFAIASVWLAFGSIAAMFIVKFLRGLGEDFRALELLVRYHDYLVTLPGGQSLLRVEQGAPPNSRPPSPLPTPQEPQSSDSLRTPSSGGCG
jgi:hypothetical protein